MTNTQLDEQLLQICPAKDKKIEKSLIKKFGLEENFKIIGKFSCAY